jgi:hypothetical protein
MFHLDAREDTLKDDTYASPFPTFLEAMHCTFGLDVTLRDMVLMMVVRFDDDLEWLMKRRTLGMVTHGL